MLPFCKPFLEWERFPLPSSWSSFGGIQQPTEPRSWPWQDWIPPEKSPALQSTGEVASAKQDLICFAVSCIFPV